MTSTVEAPAPEAEVEPGRRRRRPDRDVVLSGVVAVAFQAVLTVAGFLIERAFAPLQTVVQHPDLPATPLSHMLRWDGLWFAAIQDGLYRTNPQSPAFYPLFPVLSRGLEIASFGLLSMLAAALVLNTLGVWAAVLALVKASRRVVGNPRAGWLAVAVLLTAPPAFFLHMFYAEALFLGLGFAAYAFALHRHWAAMGLCLIPLTATRITAVLFVGLCFLEFWRSRDWRLRGLLSPHLLWFPAAFLGFGAYAWYLSAALGDPWAMFKAYDAGPEWSYHRFDPNIAGTIGDEVTTVVKAATGATETTVYTTVDSGLPLLSLALLLAVSIYLLVALRNDGVPLALFGIASFVMFTLNSNLISVHRYVLGCVSVFVAAEVLVARHPRARPVVLGLLYPAVLGQGALLALFVSHQWAG